MGSFISVTSTDGRYTIRYYQKAREGGGEEGGAGEAVYDAVVVAVPNEISNITYSHDIQRR